jgi:hypothetical protein
VVVHYVTSGPHAPPLNDDDANGVPDYVDEAASAGDRALALYRDLRFNLPPHDAGGPDQRPDIYLARLDVGLLGAALPPVSTPDGAYVLVSSQLDRETGVVSGSLQATVAHELFHVVQFAYAPDGAMPGWINEGVASLMELAAIPEVTDSVLSQYQDLWLSQPWLSLHDERFGCERCYGGILWWYYLYLLDPRIVPGLYTKLGGDYANDRLSGLGLGQLSKVLGAKGHGNVYKVFTAFAVDLYRAGYPTPVWRNLKAKRRSRTTRTQTVAGFATHYIRINPFVTRRGGYAITIGTLGGPKPKVTLITGNRKGREIKSRRIRGGRILQFIVRPKNRIERKKAMLIITSGRKKPVSYIVSAFGV